VDGSNTSLGSSRQATRNGRTREVPTDSLPDTRTSAPGSRPDRRPWRPVGSSWPMAEAARSCHWPPFPWPLSTVKTSIVRRVRDIVHEPRVAVPRPALCRDCTLDATPRAAW